MTRRRDDVLAKGLPWLVAEQGSQVLGYAYANHFRPRPAYRFSVEDSIYLRPEALGRGVGRVLLAELLGRCQAAGARQMLAVIGDSANLSSIGVHRTLGFEPCGTLRSVGWKFGRWLDVVLMQRPLGAGSDAPATGGAT
jgi:L-amino acid N-acyltransferase YncA